MILKIRCLANKSTKKRSKTVIGKVNLCYYALFLMKIEYFCAQIKGTRNIYNKDYLSK